LLPLFAAHYLPIQDLPQHAAAVRVLHEFSEPRFGFQRFFELSLGSTQYLSVYACAWLLTGLFGVVVALKLVLAIALGALPYAMRALLRALGKPEAYALLVLPLAYNSQLILGFLNFIAGLPLLFWGIKLAIELRTSGRRRVALTLGAVTLLCFFTHVVPFAILLLAGAVLAIERDFAAVLRRWLVLTPALLAFLIWTRLAPAGQALSAVVTGAAPANDELSIADRLAELPLWLNDVLPGAEDEIALWGLVAALALALLLGKSAPAPHAPWTRRLIVFSPAAALAYLSFPTAAGFIWPIHARFALLSLLLLIPVLPTLSARPRRAMVGLVLAATLLDVSAVFRAFRRVDSRETAGLADVLAEIPYGSSVAGLMFDPSSRYLKFSPFLHVVAWSQVERGGAVMFTFADFPVSPFRFRPDHRPARVPPRWEWLPRRVDTARELAFYDRVLTRRGPRDLPGLRRIAANGDWALWVSAAPPSR
jgi:hypothetical protein